MLGSTIDIKEKTIKVKLSPRFKESLQQLAKFNNCTYEQVLIKLFCLGKYMGNLMAQARQNGYHLAVVDKDNNIIQTIKGL